MLPVNLQRLSQGFTRVFGRPGRRHTGCGRSEGTEIRKEIGCPVRMGVVVVLVLTRDKSWVESTKFGNLQSRRNEERERGEVVVGTRKVVALGRP